MTNTYTMLHGDCMSLMSTMPEASYDAVITDPPYASGGLSTAARDRDRASSTSCPEPVNITRHLPMTTATSVPT